MASVKHINIGDTDPVALYGINDSKLDRLRELFPGLKIMARGDEITFSGDDKECGLLEARIKEMIEAVNMGNSPDIRDIERQAASAEHNPDQYNIVYGNEGRIVKARTRNQKRLVDEYYKNDLLFALGPAGTGKTYTAIALAVRALKNREVKKLILTRPAVEAGERLGFLPGDMKDKLDPYLQPLYDALHDMIQPKKLQMLMEEGIIQIAPLAYMRGRTLDSAFVILDEAQNTSLGQLKMFLTRMGCNAKFIVTGDATQIDLPDKRDSGLLRGVDLVKDIDGVAIINFGREDMVRHPLVSKIIRAFENGETSPGAPGPSAAETSAAETSAEASSKATRSS